MNIQDFREFAKIFVPAYEDLAKIDGGRFISVDINFFRELLCKRFPEECNMLTEPFLKWLEEPLYELHISVLYDKGNSSRTGRIGLTRTNMLNSETRKIEHYLLK